MCVIVKMPKYKSDARTDITVSLYRKTVSLSIRIKKRRKVKRMKKQRKASRKKTIDSMRLICWFVLPTAMAGFLTADAFGIYTFTKENLLVIGLCLVVILLPFFSEIKVKDISVKRSKPGSDKGT